MARPSYEAKLKANIARVREARKFRQQEGYDDLWRRMRDLYSGKHYPKKSKQDRMLVNIAFATKNVIGPSVSINNPKFVVNARKAESQPQAVIAEQVLNYLWRVNKYQDEFRLAVDDFLSIGHGWCKVGYKSTVPKKEVKIPDQISENGDEDTGVMDRASVEGNSETENVTAVGTDDRPYVERISPHDMFCDPDARNPREMKWVAQRVRRPISDVKVDERYDQKARKLVTGEMHYQRVDDDDRVIDGNPVDPHISYVDVWEYYDLRRGTVATFVLELEDCYLIKPAPIPFPFGHPFVMLRNYEIMDTFYPMGELEAIEVLQHELNETRSQMFNHRKRYNRKALIDKEAFAKEGLEALQSDVDNTMVPVDLAAAAGGRLDGVIMPMPQEAVPPDFYNMSAQITEDIDRVSGVSDYMRGAQAEIRRTATEAAMIQDAMNARSAEKLSRVESCLSELGARVVALMQMFMQGEQVIRIVGSNAQPVWVNFDADYIQGEFDFEVEGGSTQPRNESYRRQSALQLVDAMAPFIGQGVVNPQAVARHVLMYGFDIKDPEMFLAVPPPQMGAPTPSKAPPEQGGGMPPQGGPPMQGSPQEMPPPPGAPESPIKGIPPELLAQLAGQSGLPLG